METSPYVLKFRFTWPTACAYNAPRWVWNVDNDIKSVILIHFTSVDSGPFGIVLEGSCAQHICPGINRLSGLHYHYHTSTPYIVESCAGWNFLSVLVPHSQILNPLHTLINLRNLARSSPAPANFQTAPGPILHCFRPNPVTFCLNTTTNPCNVFHH